MGKLIDDQPGLTYNMEVSLCHLLSHLFLPHRASFQCIILLWHFSITSYTGCDIMPHSIEYYNYSYLSPQHSLSQKRPPAQQQILLRLLGNHGTLFET